MPESCIHQAFDEIIQGICQLKLAIHLPTSWSHESGRSYSKDCHYVLNGMRQNNIKCHQGSHAATSSRIVWPSEIPSVLCAASSNASAALELPPDVVARAWADIARPSEVAKQRLALRALAAAARYSVICCCRSAAIHALLCFALPCLPTFTWRNVQNSPYSLICCSMGVAAIQALLCFAAIG